MLRAAFLGLWLAVVGSLALTAGIIGVPMGTIVFEIVRATLWMLLGFAAFGLGRAVVAEWRDSDGKQSSI